MTGQDDVDIPETGAIFTFGKSSFADNVPSKFWLKNDQPIHLSCGGEHTAVITENGRLLMFGGNTWGQLGLGFKPAANKPASVKSLKSVNVKLVACGRDHTIVCTWQGSVFVAGSNQEGQLGLGHCNNTTSFHLQPPFCDHAPIKMLSAGCNTSAALTEDGRLFMWGDNAVGQIGLGDEGFAAEPREVDVREAVLWVSCGYHHSAFVTVDGDLYTFGESANGRLGLQVEQLANHRVPQRVQGILGRVTQVCCGGEHTVALTEENVYAFGRGQYGQLGHGTFLFEVDLPKPLEHFCNSSIKHIACGENHTAVITKSGFLYTFGDGRHGKLGLGEENFINQFSPTLCTRFVKYNVQLVSCGGNHMLVLATPRPPESQEVVPEEDVTITENVLEPIYTEIIPLDPLIDPNPLVPFSALSARARHREKGRSVELFGKMFQNLPRLNSDFLNTSWQTSRNISTPKTLSKDFTTPSSSPKTQSEATLSPPLSPRSPVLPSKPSSPRSQSSNTFQNKSSTAASFKSKSKELPSPLLSPKFITKHNTPVSPKQTAKKRMYRTAKKALIEESPLSPKEPCSPTRPSSDISKKHLSEEEHPASPQTERETIQSQIVIEELEEKGVDSDFLPNVEKKKGRALRRTTKEAELFAKRLQFNGKAEQNSLKASPTELLKGSLKKEVSPLKSLKSLKNTSKKVTSKGKENITKQSNKIKTHEDGIDRKKTSHLESPKLLASSPRTPQSVRKTPTQQRLATAVKENDKRNRNVKESIINEEDMKASALKENFIGTLKQEENKSSALDKTSSVMKVTTGNETTSISVQRGSSLSVEKDEEIQSETTDSKPVEVQMQRESQQFISTPTKDFHKVESAPGRGQNKKKETTPASTPAQVDTKKSQSVKSIPVKVKGKPKAVKSTLVKNPSKGARNTPVKSESKVKVVENELNKAQKMKGRTADNQKIPEGDSAEVKDQKKAKESKLKEKTKPGGDKGDEIRVKGEADSEDITRAKPRSKQTEVSTPIEVLCNPISSQSTQRTEVIPVSGAKSPQGPKPVDRDLLVSETHREDAQSLTEEKPMWGEILSTAAALLPVVGIAGTAMKGLSDAVTNIQGFQSDSDTVTSTPPKTPSRVKQFTKQSAVMQPSFSSTLSHFSSTEASNPAEGSTEKNVQVKKNVVQEEERNDTLQSQQGVVKSDGSEDISQTEGNNSGTDRETSQLEHKEDEKTYKDHKGGETDTEDEENKKNEESGSHVGKEEDEEESESSDDLEEEKDSVSVDGEEEQDNELAKEDGEEEGSSEKSEVTEAEEEEEESSEETGRGGSESEVSEEAEEGSESEEENKEEEEESEVSEDEDDESGQESGSSRSKESEEEDRDEGDTAESDSEEEESEMSEDEDDESGQESGSSRSKESEEEDRDEGDTSESDSEEEESEIDAEEEGEMEEEKDSTEKDSEEDEETDESEGEEDEEQDEVSVENEEEEDSEPDEDEEEQDEKSDKENEEEGEEGEEEVSLDEGEAEDETAEEEQEGEEEEEESMEEVEEEEEESKEEVGEEEEEESKDEVGEEEEEEEDEVGEEEEEEVEEEVGEEEEEESKEEEEEEESKEEVGEEEEEESKEEVGEEEEEESKEEVKEEEEEESKEEVGEEEEEEGGEEEEEEDKDITEEEEEEE
ncbi:X-linked retinitis pigmentosa GTPase regulator, partial [Perca flavescens]|uniref:X-linked retinitis pigmentosa GTPase regulator n=1 Tax=Perca flavescens TaxID=8167 RepID=UPI00106E8386